MATRNRITRRRTAVVAAALALGVPATASAAPPNDAFEDAQPIARSSGRVTGGTFDATKEPGEPAHAGNEGGRSVWYRWTAPQDGQYAFVTFDSDFDTLLAVYTGASFDTLTVVAANDDAGAEVSQSMLSFRASAGTEYRIAVDGFGGKVGKVALVWSSAPANDNFAEAADLRGRSGTALALTERSTWEPGEPAHTPDGDDDADGATVWFRWTAPATEVVAFTTENTDVDTLVAVYTGDHLHRLDQIAVNDDRPSGCCTSRVAFRAEAGRTYRIALDSYDGWGSSTLRWRVVVRGTERGETIVGSAESEELYGLGGDDTIRGGGGSDIVVGGTGADRLGGGGGDDVLRGGAGDDALRDLAGRDVLRGEAGEDRVDARDGSRGDAAHGGLGSDRCLADRGDAKSGCP